MQQKIIQQEEKRKKKEERGKSNFAPAGEKWIEISKEKKRGNKGKTV